MRIPMTQIQAASIAALPQQASRETRSSTSTAANAEQLELQINDELAKSTESGDRDAQEKYQPSAQPSEKQAEEAAQAGPPPESLPNSIWNLSVADDQPPPDLDIRG